MSPDTVDVACLIHSTGYDWIYVERLHSMLLKHVSYPIRFHVYTEAEREVPSHMIKHALQDWPGVAGPKKSWWHKMELFNSAHHQGPMLYLDLDTVIVNNIDWIFSCDPKYFWAIRDFKHLWKENWQGINSSVMWWNTKDFDWVWKAYESKRLIMERGQYQGDQDFITAIVDHRRRRFFDEKRVVSWRWQALDGGMDFKRRRHLQPKAGTRIEPDNSLLIFHGSPKPHEVLNDAEIARHWV